MVATRRGDSTARLARSFSIAFTIVAALMLVASPFAAAHHLPGPITPPALPEVPDVPVPTVPDVPVPTVPPVPLPTLPRPPIPNPPLPPLPVVPPVDVPALPEPGNVPETPYVPTVTRVIAYGVDGGDAVCERDDADCIAAVSYSGTARCEKSTCVALSVWGNAQAGCYGTRCLDPCGSPSQCGVTECQGYYAFTCVAIAASPFGQAEAYPFCHWFLQTCFGVSATHHGVQVLYCYGDEYDRWTCQSI